MPTIDLGVDYEDVKDQDKFPLLDNGTYEFRVKRIQEVKASNGRPMLKWSHAIINPTTGHDHTIFNNTVLPWVPPNETELDTGGVGMLVQQCKAVGLPWTGGKLNTDDYIGRVGQLEIKQKTRQVKGPAGTYVDDPNGEQVNEIARFVY